MYIPTKVLNCIDVIYCVQLTLPCQKILVNYFEDKPNEIPAMLILQSMLHIEMFGIKRTQENKIFPFFVIKCFLLCFIFKFLLFCFRHYSK